MERPTLANTVPNHHVSSRPEPSFDIPQRSYMRIIFTLFAPNRMTSAFETRQRSGPGYLPGSPATPSKSAAPRHLLSSICSGNVFKSPPLSWLSTSAFGKLPSRTTPAPHPSSPLVSDARKASHKLGHFFPCQRVSMSFQMRASTRSYPAWPRQWRCGDADVRGGALWVDGEWSRERWITLQRPVARESPPTTA